MMQASASPVPGRHRRRAVTLVELIIAMMITGLVALGVASMLHAAGYGTSSRREVRRLTVRAHQAQSRLGDAVRYASGVRAAADGEGAAVALGYLLLGVDTDELRLIAPADGQTDPDTGDTTYTLTCYTAAMPEEWTDEQIAAAVTEIMTEATAISDSATNGGRDFSDMSWPLNVTVTVTPWVAGVSDFGLQLDATPAEDARLVTWRLMIADELLHEPLAGAAALRVDDSEAGS